MADKTGTIGNDTLTGTAEADVINPLGGTTNYASGLGGNDTFNVVSAANTDTYNLGGGEGDDTFVIAGGHTGTIKIHGDNNVLTTDGSFVATDGSGAGSDTIKFNNALSTTGVGETQFTASNFLPSGTSVFTHKADGTALTTLNLTGVEKIEFSNVTLDLTNPNLQYFSGSDISFTKASTAADVTTGVGSFNGSDGAIAVSGVSGFTVSKVNGKAITNDGAAVDLGDFTVKLTNSSKSLEFAYETGKDEATSGVANADSVEVTLTNGTETVVRTMKISEALTIDGNADTTTGTSGNDLIDGLGGDDLLGGGAGNDTLLGGSAGDDSLNGGAGNDSLNGGDGDDTLVGGAGNDTIDGSSDAADDIATYASSIEAGALNAASVTVVGKDAGTDVLANVEHFQSRNLGDTVNGTIMNGDQTTGTGKGSALVTFGASDGSHGDFATIKALTANDSFGGEEASKIGGDGSANVSIGDDFFVLDATKETVAAATDSELDGWLITGYRTDTGTAMTAVSDTSNVNKEISTGDAGDFTIVSRKLTDSVQIVHTAKQSAVQSTDKTEVVVFEITNGTEVRHIIVDFTLTGDNETKAGTDGEDNLSGGEGNDNLSGAKGNDKLDGGDGDDTLDGGEGDDALTGGDGTDVIKGGDGNDTGNGGDGNDTFTGGKGDDAFYAGSDDDGNDNYKGEEGNDTLGGGEGDDQLHGGEGSNLLFGGDGDDTLTASAGDDSVQGDSVAWAGDGDDSIIGGSKNDQLGGGEQDDTIDGGDGNDVIYGGKTGRDNITAGKGDDKVFASTDRDTVSGGAGKDTIFGGDDSDEITGGDDNDELWGGAGSDEVKGDKGSDTIAGGAGTDTLTGGDNADTFVFYAGDGNDNITDFTIADDTLDFSNMADITNDIINSAVETKRNNKTGVLLEIDATQSVFLEGKDLGDIRDAKIVYAGE